MDAYVIGSGEKLEISADIKNEGEDAFNAMLYLQIPRGVNYINANSRFGPLKLPDY
jgi:Integrin alpha